MAKTIEVSGDGARVVDTTTGASTPVPLRLSGVSVTTYTRATISIADSTSNQSIGFGSVTAGKVFVLVPDGAVSVKLNGSATAIPVTGQLTVYDSAGGITAATWSNASGSARTAEFLVGG